MAQVKEVVKHSVARFFSVICVGLVFAGLAWAVYAAFIKPNTDPNATTTQVADKIQNNYITKEKRTCWIDMHILGINISTICREVKDKEIIDQIRD